MDKPHALILCTGNSCRSQMAEGALRFLAGDRLRACSAGTEPKPIHPLAIETMAEIGIDISGQRSKHVREYLGHEVFKWVIIVCSDAEQSCPANLPGAGERLFWPFDDPAAASGSKGEKMAVFRRVRDEIVLHLEQWLAAEGLLGEDGN